MGHPQKTEWLVRECSEHGLISVDEFDLKDCPAPVANGSGPCGAQLSEQFTVVRKD